MKKIFALFMLGIASIQYINSCPTCLGRLEIQSPAFFSDELYYIDPEDDIQEDFPIEKTDFNDSDDYDD